MYSMRDILGFLAVAAIGTTAIVLLLLSPSPCPCDVMSSHHREPLALGNGTQADDPSIKNLGMAGSSSSPEDKLPKLLRRAAMDDKTIIMTFTNEAWAANGSLMDLFLESFRVGVRTETLLKHLVVIAVDANAYDRCQQAHPLCYALPPEEGINYTSEQVYMAKDYLNMMWRRNRFQARILALGYNFVFTDVDIIWLRNPLLRIPVGADIAMSSDRFPGDNPYDLDKAANGGFVYVKAVPRTEAFYGDWYKAREAYPGNHEQFVFDQVKRELSARHGVRVQFVDTAYLSGFCELSKDFRKVCTVHANCLIGLKDKLAKLAGVLDEWKQFRATNVLTD
ncbi:unnamed protein product [Urochloa humidicola]